MFGRFIADSSTKYLTKQTLIKRWKKSYGIMLCLRGQ